MASEAKQDSTFSAAKRLYAEQFGDAIVTNTYLKIALLEQQLVTTERNRTSSVGSINAELYRQQHFGEVMSFTSSTPTRLQTPTGK